MHTHNHSYMLFWCLWLQYHRDALDFLLSSRDKKWPTPRSVEEKLAGRTTIRRSTKHVGEWISLTPWMMLL